MEQLVLLLQLVLLEQLVLWRLVPSTSSHFKCCWITFIGADCLEEHISHPWGGARHLTFSAWSHTATWPRCFSGRVER